jgi:plasmid stabilization system protein ParE
VTIIISDSAEGDLLDGRSFYNLQDSGLGDYFLDSLFTDIDSLKLFAGVHREIFGYHRLLAKRFPYAVYYSIDGSTVSVWLILDCRRDPGWIAEQLGRE